MRKYELSTFTSTTQVYVRRPGKSISAIYRIVSHFIAVVFAEWISDRIYRS